MKNQVQNQLGRLAVSFCVLFGLFSTAQGEFPMFRWVAGAGGVHNETLVGIGVDPGTNCCVVGYFDNPTQIGATPLVGGSSQSNLFLALFDMSGNPMWALSPSSDQPLQDVQLGSGVIFSHLAARYVGTNVTFGFQTVTNLDPGGVTGDVLLATHDPNGNLVWLKQLGGTGEERVGDISADLNGNTFLVGGFESATFTVDSTSTSRVGTAQDAYVVKFGFGGDVAWMKQGANAIAETVAADQLGNSYVGGTLLGAALFDGQAPANPTAGKFLVKYDSSGTLQWVRGDVPSGTQMAADRAENIFVAGTFSGTLEFGSTVLSNDASSTIFVGKCDSLGNPLWAKQVPGRGFDRVTGLMLDYRTNCWITGTFATDSGGQDSTMMVACFTPEGRMDGLTQSGDGGWSAGAGIASFMGELNYVCGTFATNISFNGLTLTNTGHRDLFVGRIHPYPPPLQTTLTNETLVLSWPDNPAGYTNSVLEVISDPGAGNWATSSLPFTLVGGQRVVTNTPAGPSGFFRLRYVPQ